MHVCVQLLSNCQLQQKLALPISSSLYNLFKVYNKNNMIMTFAHLF